MHDRVQLTEVLLQLRIERVDFRVTRNIALKGLCPRQGSDQVMGLGFHALILISNGELCSGLIQTLGNGPRDAAFVGHAKNNHVLSLHAQHSVILNPV